MVDLQTTVCCMCGDVGFSDKLFRCTQCRGRFQHSYCSNYYSVNAQPMEVCDWCRSEQRNTSSRHGNSSKRSSSQVNNNIQTRSAYSGEKIKNNGSGSGGDRAAGKNQNSSGTPSPRPTTRRYKLLKDVMC